MQRVRRPKKALGGLEKWSTRVLVALFVIGILIVLVDVGLMAGFVLQSRGISLPWWTGQPTPVVEPVVQISPLEGGPGTAIAVAGQGWQANDPLVVELEDPSGTCAPEAVATPNAGQDGRFRDSIALPSEGCWANQTRVLVVVRSVDNGLRAASEFRVIVPLQTPTPTLTWTPAVELTAVVTSTPTVEPTATQVPEPMSTAIPTATPMPESTPTATPTPVVWPTAMPTPAITDWRGEYFDNVGLIGVAMVVRNDHAIDFDWGYNAPVAGAPADGFSARWTRAWTFDAALYRFYVAADDGTRLYVDGDLIVNEWRDGSRREVTVDRWMTAGTHTLRVEYYERSGVAVARFRWEKVTSYPDWKGEYWPNLSLQGNPALVRNDPKLAFDWKQGSPGGTIPGDAFSARWTRSVAFDAGTYRFHALVDDGVRLWLNNRLIIDAWSDHNAQDLTTEYWLAKGTYALKVEKRKILARLVMAMIWTIVLPICYADSRGKYRCSSSRNASWLDAWCFNSYMVAVALYLMTNAADIVLFLVPAVRSYIEISNHRICTVFFWWTQVTYLCNIALKYHFDLGTFELLAKCILLMVYTSEFYYVLNIFLLLYSQDYMLVVACKKANFQF